MHQDLSIKTENKNVKLSVLKKDLINLQIEYPWRKEIDSYILRASLYNLDNAYNRYFKGQTGFSKF